VQVAAAPCDVSDAAAQAAAFEAHMDRHGRLDVAVLNAGVFSTDPFLVGSPTDSSWERTIYVDLVAAVAGARLAAHHMQCGGGGGDGGVIVNMASAAGVLPLPASPVYCAGAPGMDATERRHQPPAPGGPAMRARRAIPAWPGLPVKLARIPPCGRPSRLARPAPLPQPRAA
jgi:NADP-dependent 3-hydroxy acid dehydrogenase YdfG